MECNMSLVRALDMAALTARCSTLSMVYVNSVSHSKCEPY